MTDAIKRKFEELESNGTMKFYEMNGIKAGISVYIPYVLGHDKSLFSTDRFLTTDESKFFLDFDSVVDYFANSFKLGIKPEYDGVYFVCVYNIDGTYDKKHPENGYIDSDSIRRHWNFERYSKMTDEKGNEQPIEFNVHCKMKRRWADEFVSFLKYIESNGKIGHSSEVSFYADGDGDFHPEFTVDNKEIVDNLKPRKFREDAGHAECLFDAG